MAKNRTDSVYGWLAAATGFGLLWYALWTATISPLVLIGVRFPALPWCVLTTTILSIAAAIPACGAVRGEYARLSGPDHEGPPDRRISPSTTAMLFVVVVFALGITMVSGAPVLILGMTGVSIAAYFCAARLPPAPALPGNRELLLGVAGLFALLLFLYYCGSRPDGDDANFVNLAIGAQHTHGFVYQFDTMTGDGPASIHLPTYKLQTFELLGAAVSSISGLTPITVLHLVLPAPQLFLLALSLALVLLPAVGRIWLGAAIASIGFAYLNGESYGTWGVHGITRLFQGKGALLTIFAPLACGLTVRYMGRRNRWDLAGLALVHICAVGVSANGIFVTPAASGFVALSFLIADPRRHWRALPALFTTLFYPIAMSAVVILRHLGLPSEVMGLTNPRPQLAFVTGYSISGALLLAPLALAPLAIPGLALRQAAAIYIPVVLLVTLNVWGWRFISAATGNLGFRIFWSIPGPLVAGLVWTRLAAAIVPTPARFIASLSAGLLMLAGGILWNQHHAPTDLIVRWGAPGLKVDPEPYRSAQELAALRISGCAILAPQREAVWLSTQLDDPKLVYVRDLYLTHYRFTRSSEELALRWRLFRLIEGQNDATPLPDGQQLQRYDARPGLIATDPGNVNLPEIKTYAASLGLAGPMTTRSGLMVWRGACLRKVGG